MKLFMINVGGRTINSCAEVHDIQFVVGNDINDCIDELKDRFNYFESMHLDCYKVINHINSYKIVFEEATNSRLFMIYYGGYNPSKFGEVHAIDFVVAPDSKEAKRLAKENMHRFEYIDHVDEVTDVALNAKYAVSIEAGDYTYDNVPDWQGYQKLY